MDYSTFNLKNFFIRKDSTYPLLKFPLTQQLLEQYEITADMLENCAVTFSMLNVETGQYRVANLAGNLVVNTDRPEYPTELTYTLTYKFRLTDTSKVGNYVGEFAIDFLSDNANCFKLKLPTSGGINIIISDSITKTSVI